MSEEEFSKFKKDISRLDLIFREDFVCGEFKQDHLF